MDDEIAFFKIKNLVQGAHEYVFEILTNFLKDHSTAQMYGIKYDNYIQKTMAMAIDRKNLKESIDINVKQIELIIKQVVYQETNTILQSEPKPFEVNISVFNIPQYQHIQWPIELGFLFERLSLEQTGLSNTQHIATKYAIISLRIRRRYLGGKTMETANSLNTLGNCLYYMTKVHYSIVYIQEASNILQKFLGNLHQEVATNFNNIAFLLSSTGKIHESLKFHEKALKIRLKYYGEMHNEVALSYNNLAMSYSRLQQLDECKKHQLKCIEIWNEVWQGEPHPNIATGYNNLATNETYLQNYEQAYEYHLKAYNIRKAFYEEQIKKNDYPQDMVVSIDGIGITCMKLEKIEEALQYQKQALYRWAKLKGKNHNYGISLNNISQTLKRDNKWEKAFFLMKAAYQKLYEKLGDNNGNVKNAKTNFSSTKAETLKSNSTTERIIQNLCDQIDREIHDFNFFRLKFCIENKLQEESLFGLVLDYLYGQNKYFNQLLFEDKQQIEVKLETEEEANEYNQFLTSLQEGNPKFYNLIEKEKQYIKQKQITPDQYFLCQNEILQKIAMFKNQENIEQIEVFLKEENELKEKNNAKRFQYWKLKIDKQMLGSERLWQDRPDGKIQAYKQNPRYTSIKERIQVDLENRIIEHLTDIDPNKPLPCEIQQ